MCLERDLQLASTRLYVSLPATEPASLLHAEAA